jgi:hypothetical protein
MERRDEGSEKGSQKAATHADPPAERKPWEQPKLAFVEPKLTKHGNLEKLTGMPNGFFGGFSP